MAKFSLTIDTDNAAFAEGRLNAELARILLQLAVSMEAGGDVLIMRTAIKSDGVTSGPVRDINGNRCGLWKYGR